jgi:hypothetical protein
MALPREVRNIIYHELWKLHPVTRISFQDAMISLQYNNTNAEDTYNSKGMPTWLLINKAFFLEGREQFRLMTTWTFDCFPTKVWIYDPYTNSYEAEFRFHSLELSDLSKTLTSKEAKDVEDVPVKDTSIIDISTVRKITFKTQNPSIHTVKIFTVPFEDREHMHRILQTIQSKPNNLKVLRLTTKFGYKKGYADPKNWMVNLSWLEQFDLRLDRFEYEASELEQMHEVGKEMRLTWKTIQPAFEEEVGRVGKVLVGGKAVMEVKVLSKRVIWLGCWRSTLEWKFVVTRKK